MCRFPYQREIRCVDRRPQQAHPLCCSRAASCESCVFLHFLGGLAGSALRLAARSYIKQIKGLSALQLHAAASQPGMDGERPGQGHSDSSPQGWQLHNAGATGRSPRSAGPGQPPRRWLRSCVRLWGSQACLPVTVQHHIIRHRKTRSRDEGRGGLWLILKDPEL